MRSIDATYQRLIGGHASAVRDLAVANQQLAEIGRLLYRMLSEEDSNEIKKAQQRLEPAKVEFLARIRAAAAAAPALGEHLTNVAADFEGRLDKIKEVEALSWQGQTVKAQALMSFKINPGMEAAMAEGSAIATQLDAEMRAASAEAARLTERTIKMTLASGGLGVTISLLLATLMIRTAVSRPLRRLGKIMQELANGNYTVVVAGQARGDEIGEMARSVQVFKENGAAVARLRAEQEEAKHQAEGERRRALHDLADRFDTNVRGVVQNVAAEVSQLRSTADSLSVVAVDTARRAEVVRSGADQASGSVQTVALAAEELSASIAEISRQVDNASHLSAAAVEGTQRTTATIAGLAAAAQRIGDVMQLITGVAAQTNLLALNATIEAARAGEAGKGFAVVAHEVKTLATQTARATNDIAQQIEAMRSATTNTVVAIEEIAGSIAEISNVSAAIAVAVSQQRTATLEIARSIQMAATGTEDVSQNIHSLQQVVGEASKDAEQMLVTSRELSDEATTLSSQVDGFLSTVRAA